MCDTCGCGSEETIIRTPGEAREHERMHAAGVGHHHAHPHPHAPEEAPAGGETIAVNRDVLQENNRLAERNRGYFQARDIFALNLVSSPGSGKTTLLERTIGALKDSLEFRVIEGDQQSMQDANRIEATGVPVVQVNTGKGCHLDARMINHALGKLDPPAGSVLLIENVGNLVCPSLFDLGERHKVVIISVTEGDDKPAKYPTMFAASDICILNKIDLLPYVDFDLDQCKEYARKVQPNMTFFELSSKTGEGMDAWHEWIRQQIAAGR